ncbi:bacteriohemerythrin [Azospirillum sp.]|uniref:bacteriohemerythrin n=1 Tax=Azospirillum sp. TaxID=34012 RepID=UPI002D447BC7|nr:bacteriohemerythrin [Azospirillum sp.]HYD68373.1 bacteriohemerythrin [Azospirillum sp.]
MSYVDWPGQLPLGVPELDEDHRELVDTLNGLHDTLAAGTCGRDAASLLLRFVRLAREHFGREEALMAERGYPAAAEHGREHGELLSVLSFMLDAVRTGQAGLDERTLDHVRRWLCGHIENSDAALARFLVRRAVRQG